MLPDRLFTHFAWEENLARLTGKLEGDLIRTGEITRVTTGTCVVILNEIRGGRARPTTQTGGRAAGAPKAG